MDTMFDKPQWRWEHDDKVQHYGGIPNVVEVCPDTGGRDKYHVTVAIPAEFHKLLKDLNIHAVKKLYLEQSGSRWVFGLHAGGVKYYDLWYYTKHTRPPWSLEYYKVKP